MVLELLRLDFESLYVFKLSIVVVGSDDGGVASMNSTEAQKQYA